MDLQQETQIRKATVEDIRNHPAEVVITLRNLLADGGRITPDPKRADFFEVESDSLVYYVHISPATGRILLLATWPAEGTLATAHSSPDFLLLRLREQGPRA